MILIGDSAVAFEDINVIKNQDDILKTQANSTVLFSYNLALMQHCYENALPYGVIVSSIKQSIYANALGARYIISDNKKLAKKIQKIAENYLFDSKNLLIINKSEEIESVALKQIDGVIYKGIL